MEKLQKLKSKYSQGFSLLEVVISLLIFSSSVIAIYQIIVSAQVSSQTMRDKVMAREIANNRYAMLETIDYPISLGSRSGIIKMAGQDWLWKEETKGGKFALTWDGDLEVVENIFELSKTFKCISVQSLVGKEFYFDANGKPLKLNEGRATDVRF